MTINTSGFGAIVTIIASNTFPVGIPITQFTDDADAFDFSNLQIADGAMGVNGDLITWAKANPIKFSLNVIVGSDDDVALTILAQANRPAQGKISANDAITAVIVYPDQTVVTLSGGYIETAAFGKSLASAGRLKTKQYSFVFQNIA